MTLEISRPMDRLRWRSDGALTTEARTLAEETPVAIVHDGSTTAVMMATPADLHDFAVGFSLSEGIIASQSDIRDAEIVESEGGVEVRIWLQADCSGRLLARRRRVVGPTGCGLCGIDSLDEAMKPPPLVADQSLFIEPDAVLEAMTALQAAQPLSSATRAVHAAGLWRKHHPLVVREDVGRHNALDKLIGAVAKEGASTIGVVLLTSRVSVEMVQKTAVLGAPILCAVSAPTALAIRVAEAANLTLIGVARPDGFEVFTRPDRVRF